MMDLEMKAMHERLTAEEKASKKANFEHWDSDESLMERKHVPFALNKQPSL